MKTLSFLFVIPLVLAFTRPYQRDGSVNTDDVIMQERIERAQENRREQKEALQVLEEEKQAEEEDRADHPPREELNEAEKLVR